MNKINTFNTGRKYTLEGQRIAWTEIASKPAWHDPDEFEQDDRVVTVSFADVDRGIDGTVELFTHNEIWNSQVLAAYDRGGYGYDSDRERVRTLETAAKV